jgi:hypothetical protein
MSRLKPLLFVVGLSLVSAVTLRLFLGRVATSMQPQVAGPMVADSSELSRRVVGCGQFHFVFDSLGYRTGQWPTEVDSSLASRRLDAVFLARDGSILPVEGSNRGSPIGQYLIRRDTVFLTLGRNAAGLRARLVPVGDSLGGRLELHAPPGSVVGRLFIGTPPVGLGECSGP